MSAKRRFAGAVLGAILAATMVRAEAPKDLPYLAPDSAKSILTANTETAVALPDDLPPPVHAYAPDAWVYQQQPSLCCPSNYSGPIGTELYARVGISRPLAADDFKQVLRTGWEVMGGGRTLFFAPDATRAWIVDLGLSYTLNNGHSNRSFTLTDGSEVTVRNLHRTAVSMGLGHEWYVFGPGATGYNECKNWRYGFDGGARWGTAHLDLNPIGDPGGYARIHDVYGAAFAALNLSWEKPLGAWTFLLGVRGEWSYSFMDFFPAQSTSLHDLNLLLTLGARW